MENFRRQLARSATRFEIGGFRPPQDEFESWFGRVNVCAPGESWPESGGKPMHALCQINMRTLATRPERLADIDLIAIFVGPDDLPIDTPNGENSCLRAYKNIDTLVGLPPRDTKSQIRALPMRPIAIQEDFPCWEDVPTEIAAEVDEHYFDLFENIGGLKLGGWPMLVQSEIYWAPWNRHPALPEYVFQIDSTEKGNWMWGDAGVGYFGRGTAPGMEDEWALAWQCL
ncbi:DUF1963 domain-containing protein [Massilia sp. CF038]|uniref:DUF1963 domain-containing protein n=1 Tax=Massilia sp. CF038 TaxID=1881045 RepID=UPI00092094F7|nr:DUF1963 domain-containing protein [Massilia sp. CF038]SHH10610.1 Uncharacterized protein YwqG [Massilia sp. CF038]